VQFHEYRTLAFHALNSVTAGATIAGDWVAFSDGARRLANIFRAGTRHCQHE
jgi:hypothetical protein